MPEPRHPEYQVEEFLLTRWSPRSFVAQPIPDEDLMSLFEAARWAPSSYNNQPWRFLYAKRETPSWTQFFNLLNPGNQVWVANASALILVLSHSVFDYNGKPSVSHSFDAGAAWQNFALQAWIKGYITHGMEGFDYTRARTELEVPADFTVEMMLAVGKQGAKEVLPEKLQGMEFPSVRRPISESIAEGKFSHHLLHAGKK